MNGNTGDRRSASSPLKLSAYQLCQRAAGAHLASGQDPLQRGDAAVRELSGQCWWLMPRGRSPESRR
eukprot:8511111-Heterocapsa_arctica.AAC.1